MGNFAIQCFSIGIICPCPRIRSWMCPGSVWPRGRRGLLLNVDRHGSAPTRPHAEHQGSPALQWSCHSILPSSSVADCSGQAFQNIRWRVEVDLSPGPDGSARPEAGRGLLSWHAWLWVVGNLLGAPANFSAGILGGSTPWATGGSRSPGREPPWPRGCRGVAGRGGDTSAGVAAQLLAHGGVVGQHLACAVFNCLEHRSRGVARRLV